MRLASARAGASGVALWVALALFLYAAFPASAQDTVRVLDEVEVSGQPAPPTLRTAAPTQVVDAARLREQGAVQLSDAVQRMAGVTLKDYGGVGGMKTVSARGLGSQFSTITIDGVAVNDAQNGQVDLGRYMLGNAAYVSLSQGQEQSALLSARAYAAGNVVNLETAEPQFFLLQRNNYKVSMEAGSFGMLSPSALWEHKWSRRLRSSLWAGWLKSDGDYPFTLYYTSSRGDSSSRERRQHSAMGMFTADANLFYNAADGSSLTVKLHHMNGMHELPGHVRLYRQEPSGQSTRESQSFAQARWRKERSRWGGQLLGKLERGNDTYEDSNYLHSASHYLMNTYRQADGYGSASARWSPLPWLDLGAAADADFSRLHSNLGQRNDVARRHVMGVLNARLHTPRVEARAHLLAVAVRDRVADLDTMPSYRRLTPYASLMYTPVMGLTLRAFYKQTYRVPNFSELYFFQSMPRNLRPERAHQAGVGVTCAGNTFSATVDAYFNRVEDKIVARPGQNMFYWSMENLGLVHVAGIDATASARLGDAELRLNYSFAHATDRTDPTSDYYGHQIRYTPRHSGGGEARWSTRWVNIGLSAMVVGRRYTMPQNTLATSLPAYCDLGLTLDRRFDTGPGSLVLRVQALNLLDVQYEVVQYYPMMGRNYRIAMIYEL